MMAKKKEKAEAKPKQAGKKKNVEPPVKAAAPAPARKSRKTKLEPEAEPVAEIPAEPVVELPPEESKPAKKSRRKKGEEAAAPVEETPAPAEVVEPEAPAVAEDVKPAKKSRKKKGSAAESDNGAEPAAQVESVESAENTGDAPPDEHAEVLASGEVPTDEVTENADESGEPAAPPVDLEELARTIEALLFAAEEPIAPREIARASGSDSATVRKLLPAIKEAYAARRNPWDIVEIAGGFRMVTRPEFFPAIQRLKTQTAQRKLTQAALETLALIAYRQPIGRAEVESVRGVGAGPVIRILLEKKLIKISGRGTGLGQPLLYGTTDYFLEHFGLNTIADLPKPQEFKGA